MPILKVDTKVVALSCIRITCNQGDCTSHLASIPDVVAGSLSQVLTTYYQGGTMPKVTGLMVPPPSNLSYKDAEIMNWFADQTQPLKRLVYVIEQIEGTTKLNVKNLWFHGLADYQGAG